MYLVVLFIPSIEDTESGSKCKTLTQDAFSFLLMKVT